jgi:hypothetical protein
MSSRSYVLAAFRTSPAGEPVSAGSYCCLFVLELAYWQLSLGGLFLAILRHRKDRQEQKCSRFMIRAMYCEQILASASVN